eukprot:Pgem_evm1s7250
MVMMHNALIASAAVFTLSSMVSALGISKANPVDIEKYRKYNNQGHNIAVNHNTGFSYNVTNDCSTGTVECGENQYCQVNFRENWYPYSISYITRGRCVEYKKEGESCKHDWQDVEDDLVVHGWMAAPSACGKGLACTKDKLYALKNTCVRVKDPKDPCLSTMPRCAGREPPQLNAEGNDFLWEEWENDHKCLNPYCATSEDPGYSKEDLEYCASIYINANNGPNSGQLWVGEGTEGHDAMHTEAVGNAHPGKDNQYDVIRVALDNSNPKLHSKVNQFLEPIWPFPVCKNENDDTTKCTQFPLKAKENVKKVSTYQCTWGMFHTLANNGNRMLTTEQTKAFLTMIKFTGRNMFCTICRSNLLHMIEELGLPEGITRDVYSKWFWQAHNNANEHSYATHSIADKLAPRNSDWANPNYENPFWLEYEHVPKMWKMKEN